MNFNGADKSLVNYDPSSYCSYNSLSAFKQIRNPFISDTISTGFQQFDRNLQGGVRPGLYVIGAVSGLGKTSFVLQIADQIAQQGTDVLFFSLEMSSNELQAKSISRYLCGVTPNQHIKTSLQIMSSHFYKDFSPEEISMIDNAILQYSNAAKNLYFFDGPYNNQPLSALSISEICRKHTDIAKRTPVIFVDYLQLLGLSDSRISTKQSIDMAVYELKKLSKDLNTTVFVISSFNRDSYFEPVSKSSFKESGGIEYTADYLFGLQYNGMDYVCGEKESTRNERIRNLITNNEKLAAKCLPVNLELKCLKSRNSGLFSMCFDAVYAYGKFSEKIPKGESSVKTTRII